MAAHSGQVHIWPCGRAARINRGRWVQNAAGAPQMASRGPPSAPPGRKLGREEAVAGTSADGEEGGKKDERRRWSPQDQRWLARQRPQPHPTRLSPVVPVILRSQALPISCQCIADKLPITHRFAHASRDRPPPEGPPRPTF